MIVSFTPKIWNKIYVTLLNSISSPFEWTLGPFFLIRHPSQLFSPSFTKTLFPFLLCFITAQKLRCASRVSAHYEFSASDLKTWKESRFPLNWLNHTRAGWRMNVSELRTKLGAGSEKIEEKRIWTRFYHHTALPSSKHTLHYHYSLLCYTN